MSSFIDPFTIIETKDKQNVNNKQNISFKKEQHFNKQIKKYTLIHLANQNEFYIFPHLIQICHEIFHIISNRYLSFFFPMFFFFSSNSSVHLEIFRGNIAAWMETSLASHVKLVIQHEFLNTLYLFIIIIIIYFAVSCTDITGDQIGLFHCVGVDIYYL